MAAFFSLMIFEQLGYFTNKSKTAGVIRDKTAIIIAPSNEIIKSKSGVAAATITEIKNKLIKQNSKMWGESSI